ncbi:hypothetical protein ES707_12851 [subsurface metagenome]
MKNDSSRLARRITYLGALLSSLTGCASAPLTTAGSLASYDGLTPADGVVTHSRMKVDKAAVLAAKSVSIAPTSFSGASLKAQLNEKQRRVIANAVDRSICIGLSDRYYVVPTGRPADLSVHATITDVTVTNTVAAGTAKVVSVAGGFAAAGVPVPRIPLGMGSLSIEAEAKDVSGRQKAAFIWARGADMLTSSPRVSESGDAYDLAGEFGADFSKLLVTGDNPFDKSVSLPSMQRVKSSLGGAPKNAACDAFGRTGVGSFLGGKLLGTPPEWTDDATPEAKE